jgi:hypothetical protein
MPTPDDIKGKIASAGHRAIRLVTEYWIFIALVGGALLSATLFSLGWDFWAERTFKDGKLYEVKSDRTRIIVVALAIPALTFAIWRTWTAHKQAKYAGEQARIAGENIKLVERGQNIERYSKAAQLLDSDRPAVRLAGIYALRELAISDPENSYALAMNLLAGYIRNTTERRDEISGPERTDSSVVSALEAISSIRAIAKSREFELRKNFKLDLRGVCLDQRQLNDLDLANVNLNGSSFHGLILEGCDCRCDMWSASFTQTTFQDCLFNDVWLTYAALFNTEFVACDFTGARLGGDRWMNVTVEDCNLSGATISSGGAHYKRCWAWQDTPPRFEDSEPVKFEVYDPGPGGENRRRYMQNPKTHFMGRGESPPAEYKHSSQAG